MSVHRCNLARVLGLIALASSASAAAPVTPPDPANAPCRIQQRARIIFPYRALVEGVVHGEAVLMLDVDRMGQLGDVLVVGYTRPEFADAAVDAVRQWNYLPARIDGEPAGATITLNARFEVDGVLAYVKPLGLGEAGTVWDERFAYQPWTLDALDRIPAVLAQPGPVYPREWIDAGRRGTVTVEFFIDEKGRVRFPRVLNQADVYLGGAALAAVREWRFAPPVRKGRPVLARVSQVFHFEVPANPASAVPRATR